MKPRLLVATPTHPPDDPRIRHKLIATLPEVDQQLYNAMPGWVNTAFGIATVTGTIGTVLLVMKKNLAGPFLAISLVAVLAQQYYSLLGSETLALKGATAAIMPVLVTAISVYLVMLARQAKANGWTS